MAYAGNDLVCYRAGAPDGLVRRADRALGPRAGLGQDRAGRAAVSRRGRHRTSPSRETSLDGLREALLGRDAFSLAALHVMTGLTGSALLALAVALGRLTPEAAWEAAHVDEDWQISQWGQDAEAAERRQNRWRDFAAATRALALTQDHPPE